jgi:uncharacterized protein
MKKLFLMLLVFVNVLLAENRFITIYIQDQPFLAEIADTPEKQSRGLMFRQKIKDNYSMLFVFPEEDTRSFWMKNTLIALDIIFLNRRQQIVDIFAAVPPCYCDPCPAYTSKLPAQYVLEINGGLAKKLKLQIGDKIYLPVD